MKNIFSKISKEDKRVVKIVIIMFLTYHFIRFLIGVIVVSVILLTTDPNVDGGYKIPENFDGDRPEQGEVFNPLDPRNWIDPKWRVE